jgi:hypothetical protein
MASAVMAYMFLDYFINLGAWSANLTSYLQNLGVVVAAFAIVLAALNILLFHGKKVQKRGGGWLYSVCLLIMFGIVLLIGIPLGSQNSNYMWIQQNIYTPTSAAVWGIMGFYYVAACYTVFRVKNMDAVILFTCAMIVVLNNAPAVAAYLPQIKPMAGWLQDIPGTSGIRGAYITIGIGLVALALRVMLLIEKKFFIGGE